MNKYPYETVVGIFVVAGLLCVGYMALKLGRLGLFSEDTYVLYARFSSVSGLRAGDPVEMFGIRIGDVQHLKVDQRDKMALVKLRIKDGTKIYGDANASIKTMGLIGDRYVSVDPGGGDSLLKPGGMITQTEPPVTIGNLIGNMFGGVKKD
jgi:phospholipid/cholesterol/gamma-HCH transport system substrate-binding protein